MDLNILIVDDNAVCREHATKIAQKYGNFISVSCGDEAVEAFINTFRNQARKFDIILLDYEMPGMSGIEVIIQVRKAEEKRKIPIDNQVKIIMTTSHNDMDVVKGCKAVGCNHYILKPLIEDQFKNKLNQLKLL